MASSFSNTVSSEKCRKQLSRKHQKWFRNKNRENILHLFDDVSKELQYLLNIKVLTVVVEPIETSAIDTDSSSDSDDLLPLPNTEVPIITNHKFTNTQSNQNSRCDKTKRHDMDQNSGIAALKFSLCCANNKVQLLPLLEPPPYLLNLYTSTNPDIVEFHKHARGYNSALACTSFGANIDNQFLEHGIANFRIHGQVYLLIELLLPNEGRTLAFAQLYIYDTANKITNRQNAIHELNKNILQSLQNMLDICNPYIQNFQHVRDIICNNVTTEISMIIQNLQDVANHTKNRMTTLTAWFQENMQNPMAHIYSYVNFPSYYTWNSSCCKWIPRKTSATMIGATSFDDLKTINDYTYNKTPTTTAFATILLFCQPVKSELLWNNHKIALCKDILYQAHVQLQDLEDANDIPAAIENKALTQLENILLLNRKSLKNFPNMPIPSITSNISNNEEKLNHLIREERSYNITDLEAKSQCNIPLLNNDQCAVFDAVIRAIDNKERECFFIDRP
ncbi:16411_t:CDS:2, partial [Dentiscutata erythropus]